MLRRWTALMTAAVLVAVIAVPASAQREPEVVGIRLVAHPDQEGMGRRGLVSIVADVQPGAVVERQVIVSNDTTDAQRLQVYVGDATIDDSGFVPADGQGEVASWSEVNPSIVELDPGERQTATVTIEVPDRVTNGERYGVVWVQPPARGGDIQQVNRVGVRIYLTVTGGADPEAEAVTDFVITSMTADALPAGDRQVRAAVVNTGERAIDLVGDLELLDGPGGLRAGPFPTDEVTTVAIGGSAAVTVTISSEVPRGPWLARLQLASGAVERAAEATVHFPAAVEDEPDVVVAEMTPVERQRQILIPIASTMIVTLLVIALVLLLGRRREAAEDDSAGAEGDAVIRA